MVHETVWSAAFTATSGLSVLLAAVLLLFAGVYLYTLVRFRVDLGKFQNAAHGHNIQAPRLPVAIPWVGNAPSFLTTKPHKFWKDLFSWYPRTAGVCSIVLGGQHTVLIFNPLSIQYIMKDRKLGREEFSEQILVQGLGVSKQETDAFYGHNEELKDGEISAHVEQEKMHNEYLLKTDRVNELTREFINSMEQQYKQSFVNGQEDISLYAWLRRLMFDASTHALMGSKILEICPDLETQFFQFDQDMLSLFFGLPNFMIRDKVRNRDQILDALAKWHEVVTEVSGKEIVDPNAVPWEPLYGSRINRARQTYYRKRGLSYRGAAGLDLGMLFGLSSNAIPATAWMLMHILESTRPENRVKGQRTLYELVMVECLASQNTDGTINVSALINQPILQSTLHEVLRLYVDTLVSRQVNHDMTLPISHSSLPSKDTPVQSSRSISVKAGSLLMMPSYPTHTNPETWPNPAFPHHPPANTFYPYRFLETDPSDTSQKPVFTTAHTTGMFFPFGGGKTICPGRVFAKQEMIGSVALALLTFDFEVLGYVDGKGSPANQFPGLRDTLPGSAVMVAGGDMKVRAKRRQ